MQEKTEEQKVKQEKIKKKTKMELRALLVKIGVIMGAAYILLHFVIGVSVNHGNNMYPAVKDGDLCIAYKLKKYSAGSVVAFEQDGVTRHARIVATEGHVVNITNEGLIIDDSTQYEKVVYDTTPEGTTIDLPYTVPQGCVFLMNDYREDPSDSRIYGAYEISELKGSLMLVLRRREI